MIKTNNVELDAVFDEVLAQRNNALDDKAIIAGKLRIQEALNAALQKQLDEFAKSKAEEKKEGEQ